MLDHERGASGANITNFGDALWWAMTTVTTVGYGDRFPVTTTGRFIAAAVMIAGIAILGTLTATIASWLIENLREEAVVEVSATLDRVTPVEDANDHGPEKEELNPPFPHRVDGLGVRGVPDRHPFRNRSDREWTMERIPDNETFEFKPLINDSTW